MKIGVGSNGVILIYFSKRGSIGLMNSFKGKIKIEIIRRILVRLSILESNFLTSRYFEKGFLQMNIQAAINGK